jgi:proline iminopeptidase
MDLYPPVEAYSEEFIQVSKLHNVHFEQAGNPDGKPVLFLHGGPGGGLDPVYRQFFDPSFYRIILVNQRGCGKSTPHAELQENTTWELVNDIENIRLHLNIQKWMVFGGSWGSTLALSYAIKHTDHVQSLVLRGIFLCRKKEIHWFYQDGCSKIYPDLWKKYIEQVPIEKRKDMVKAYYELLTHEDEKIRLQAAIAWSTWEAGTSKLIIDPKAINDFEDPHLSLAFARIECHYFINQAFMPADDWLLQQSEKHLADVPTTIIQGRYDVVCPAETSWELKEALPHCKYIICQDCGHSSLEKGISSALVTATEEMKETW